MDNLKDREEKNETFERFISIRSGSDLCNPEWAAYSLYLKNTHHTNSIWSKIEISTQVVPPVDPTYVEYTIAANSEIHIGCPIPGPTGQRFYYRIVKSRWA
nr:hypothetical protein [uncultured Flavobacterium sp.]